MTGRKHQIRRHLAGLGHPIVGDRRYGGTRPSACPPNQIMLHCWRGELDGHGVFYAPPTVPGIYLLIRLMSIGRACGNVWRAGREGGSDWRWAVGVHARE